jgi:dUTP pyrophosphatase|nr:MAG TPA: homing endonuclease [Caudoviricetes sp.]
MNFNIGDKVRIKEDLNEYNYFDIIPEMLKYAGKESVILNVNESTVFTSYDLEGIPHTWYNNALEPIEDTVTLCSDGNEVTTFSIKSIKEIDKEWKDIKNYEGVYQINNIGQVKSLKRNIILKPKINRQGYYEYQLYKKGEKSTTISAHRLVAIHFIPNPFNLPVVNHIDGDKANNKVENLEWCTYSHNNKHAYDTGLNKTKSVIKMDMNENFIKKYKSIKEACLDIGMATSSSGNIIKVCKGEKESSGGFKWKYSVRGFEIVSDKFRKHPNVDIQLPQRNDKRSAGYDLRIPCKMVIPPHSHSELEFTDICAYMQDDEVLKVFVRSSIGCKKGLILANGTGIIDASYYPRNIGIKLYNTTDKEVVLEENERVCQCIFEKYLTTDDDCCMNENRVGGFGSSNK